MFRYAPIVIGLLLSFNAQASCDACAKAALDAASGAISSSVGATTNLVSVNNQTVELMNTNVQAGTQTLVSSLELLNQKEITALDGVAKTITLTIDRLGEEQIRATDHLVSSLKKIEEDLRVGDLAIETSKQVGPMSQTLSGDINTARAHDLMMGVATRKELKKLYRENMELWLQEPAKAVAKSGEMAVLLDNEDFWDILPLLQKDILTNEEVNNLHVLLQLLVEPNPQPKASAGELASGDLAVKKELARLRKNALSRVAHDTLTNMLADKAPIIPTDESWLKSYFKLNTGDDDKISFEQFYEAETTGKILSPDWFLDIKSRTEAGLLREQIYQTNTSNAILAEILKAERDETRLLTLSILQRSAL